MTMYHQERWMQEMIFMVRSNMLWREKKGIKKALWRKREWQAMLWHSVTNGRRMIHTLYLHQGLMKSFNCFLNGRPGSEYLNIDRQPRHCNAPGIFWTCFYNFQLKYSGPIVFRNVRTFCFLCHQIIKQFLKYMLTVLFRVNFLLLALIIFSDRFIFAEFCKFLDYIDRNWFRPLRFAGWMVNLCWRC